MAVAETLVELAEEHLRRMAAVPWAAYAKSLRQGKAGETFGCEVGGRYFDVGDQASWLEHPEGDIRLIAHATAEGRDLDPTEHRVEREAIIRRA